MIVMRNRDIITMVIIMTMKDIIVKYREKLGYTIQSKDYYGVGEDVYRETRKKLLRAFECLGCFEAEWLKSENGKDYDFLEEDCDYIIELIEKETSPLFKKVKYKKLDKADYIEYVVEVERFVQFAKKYLTEDNEIEVVGKIYAETRFLTLTKYISLKEKINCFERRLDKLMEEEYSDSLYLTLSDEAALLDEMGKNWSLMIERLGEHRSDEAWEHFEQSAPETDSIYEFALQSINERFLQECESVWEDTPSKSISDERNKLRRLQEKDKARWMQIATDVCEERNLDLKVLLEITNKVEQAPTNLQRIDTGKAIENLRKTIAKGEPIDLNKLF